MVGSLDDSFVVFAWLDFFLRHTDASFHFPAVEHWVCIGLVGTVGFAVDLGSWDRVLVLVAQILVVHRMVDVDVVVVADSESD